MGALRIYKKFYHISVNESTEQSLFSPETILASSFIAGTGGTPSSAIVESYIPVVEESLGVFYAELSPKLYLQDEVYDVVFTVNYIAGSPSKKLSSRFRLKPYNIANELSFEINKSTNIDYTIT